jgi:hypothetical protein
MKSNPTNTPQDAVERVEECIRISQGGWTPSIHAMCEVADLRTILDTIRSLTKPDDEMVAKEPHLEIRPDSDGEFDEIVARFADGMVHAEMMSDKSCYVGFSWDDGRRLQWWFGTKKGKLWNNHEIADGEPPRFIAHGIDRKPHLPDPIKAITLDLYGEAPSDA